MLIEHKPCTDLLFSALLFVCKYARIINLYFTSEEKHYTHTF